MKRVIVSAFAIIVIVGVFTKLALNLILDNGSCLEATCISKIYNKNSVDIELKGSDSISIEFATEYLDDEVNAFYNELDISNHMQVRTDLDIYTSGTYSYEYFVIIGDEEFSIKREIKVLKDYGVDFELLGSKKLTLDYDDIYMLNMAFLQLIKRLAQILII